MKEYIEREALIAKLDTRAVRYDSFGMGIVRGLEIAKEVAKRMPYREIAADVVEVVRCKDCKYYKPPKQSAHWEHKVPYCCRVTTVKVQQDGFCSYGERRSDR